MHMETQASLTALLQMGKQEVSVQLWIVLIEPMNHLIDSFVAIRIFWNLTLMSSYGDRGVTPSLFHALKHTEVSLYL